MKQGFRNAVTGVGLLIIAGFMMPWLSRDPFHISGLTLALQGQGFLFILPLCGVAAIVSAMRRTRQRPHILLYSATAGLLTLVGLMSVIFFSDNGLIRLEEQAGGLHLVSFRQTSGLLLFHPIRNIGSGLIMTLFGLAALVLCPALTAPNHDLKTEDKTDSHQRVLPAPALTEIYKRTGLVFISLSVLVVTWIWCGISPSKLWENRGNARDYLFGRALSEDDLQSIQEHRKRGPMIEAAGQAEEYMSNKYRDVPFSKQPSAEAKAGEREQMTAFFLSQMSEEKKIELEKRAEKNILKKKKGGYFPPETSSIKIKGYMTALIETIAIAIWGTLLALICAIPTSFLAAQNTLKLMICSDDMKSRSLRSIIAFGVRRFLDACRGFNEFVMALIFVAVIGLGPYAGILALWIHTFGILGKVFSEQIEAIESGQVEALTSTGGSAIQTIAFSVIPQVLPGFVSYTLLRFESNVRSAAILGFVGAGGIGFLIFDKLNGYLFREVCTMMIIIIVTVGIIDHFCARIRMKFI